MRHGPGTAGRAARRDQPRRPRRLHRRRRGMYCPAAPGGSIASFDREGGELPQTTIVAGPAEGETTVGAPTFEFVSSAPGSTFACAVDGAAPAPCASPHTVAALVAGAHGFSVVAIDPFGNADPTPAARAFVFVPPPEPPPPPPPPLPPPSAPANVAKPKVQGRALIGRRVTCARGSWTGTEPLRYAVRWLRGARTVGNRTSYRVVAADRSKRLRCRVTALPTSPAARWRRAARSRRAPTSW